MSSQFHDQSFVFNYWMVSSSENLFRSNWRQLTEGLDDQGLFNIYGKRFTFRTSTEDRPWILI